MTESEAMKNIKGILGECTEFENAVCYVTDIDVPALDVAIRALEKQCAKQIIKSIKKEEGNRVYHFCPCCHQWLTRMTKYCSNCGQKLDWSDEE